MGIAPQERPNIPPRPPQWPKTGGEIPAKAGLVWNRMEPGFFKDYFRNNPKLATQDFYEVPMRKLSNYDPEKTPWAEEIIRDASGQIAGLPKLEKGGSWVTFTGPDGKLYATESTEATSEEIGKFLKI